MGATHDLRKLLEGAAGRYRTVRMTVLHHLDLDAYGRGRVRFNGNPHLASTVERGSGDPRWRGVREEVRRVSFRHPAFHREEVYADRSLEQLINLEGGDGDLSWSYNPRTARASSWRDESIGVLVPLGQRQVHGREALAGGPPVVAHWFHPLVGELLQPAELLDEDLSLDVLKELKFLARDAIEVRAHMPGWHEDRNPAMYENLPPADDYLFLVDAATGVLLRVAARFDGEEFSVREALEVAFDDELSPELFEPPRRTPGPWGSLWRPRP